MVGYGDGMDVKKIVQPIVDVFMKLYTNGYRAEDGGECLARLGLANAAKSGFPYDLMGLAVDSVFLAVPPERYLSIAQRLVEDPEYRASAEKELAELMKE
ncbi:MAG: hypothetical protein HY365_02665 [Candidatus Aenigmarchaeota archaeon]|nr:hypothetical protein [Candidatus Aenigmarchaeota archaeon]